MGAFFLLLLTCILVWYITGTLWMSWALLKPQTRNELLITTATLKIFNSQSIAWMIVFLIPLFLSLILPFICVFVHPDSVPMGMLYFGVLVDIFIGYFIFKIISPRFNRILSNKSDLDHAIDLEKRHLQLNTAYTIAGIVWMYLLWKVLVA